jgi:hypothetical protein
MRQLHSSDSVQLFYFDLMRRELQSVQVTGDMITVEIRSSSLW